MSQLLLFMALLPGILILIYIYHKDKLEPEPKSMILKTVLLGVGSCIPAALAEWILGYIYPNFMPGTLGYALVNAFLLAAFCEEIVKYLALRIATWNSPEFNYRFDGVVYGVCSAVGFALFENITYVMQYGFGAALTRAFTAVPLHSFCGVFMGIFYAYSKKAQLMNKKKEQRISTLLALGIPMLIHGIYDTFSFLRASYSFYCLLIFIFILYIISIMQIRSLSKKDIYGGFYPIPQKISQPDLRIVYRKGNELNAQVNINSLEYMYKLIKDSNILDIAINTPNYGIQRYDKTTFLNKFKYLDAFMLYYKDQPIDWGLKISEENMNFIVLGDLTNNIYMKQIKKFKLNLN